MPTDAAGFVPVDAHGRVRGLRGVYAAGDGTNFPIKQGGLATQQADAVAEAIAAEVGAQRRARAVPPGAARRCCSPAATTATCATRSPAAAARARWPAHALWWPPTKIAGRYLSGYLFDRDDAQTVEEIRHGHLEVEIPLDAHAPAGHS